MFLSRVRSDYAESGFDLFRGLKVGLIGDDAAATALLLTTDHWSFQSLKRPAVPTSGDGFVCNAIDDFVLANLRKRNLTLGEPADRWALIRRLYLVAHGLPRTPAVL